jgi:hypothetical protein
MNYPILFLAIATLFFNATSAQFKSFYVEPIQNNGKVPGRTWRVYAEMTNAGDQLFVVFGDSIHKIEIASTKPFFQATAGSALAKDINRKEASENELLRFDSWITIGAEDNYDNNTSTLNLNLESFEKMGGKIDSGKEGAWFCIPTNKQAYSGEDRRILLMQLTTEGQISGKLSLMGKSKDGTSYTKYDQTFECGKN